MAILNTMAPPLTQLAGACAGSLESSHQSCLVARQIDIKTVEDRGETDPPRIICEILNCRASSRMSSAVRLKLYIAIESGGTRGAS